MTLSCPGNYLVIVLQNNYSETQVNAREFKFLVYDCLILHSKSQVAQSSEQTPITCEVVGSILTSDSSHPCEELVSRGFIPGTPVCECWQDG